MEFAPALTAQELWFSALWKVAPNPLVQELWFPALWKVAPNPLVQELWFPVQWGLASNLSELGYYSEQCVSQQHFVVSRPLRSVAKQLRNQFCFSLTPVDIFALTKVLLTLHL